MPHLELAILFFLVAIIYSSAGFGGGSSYLALMAIFGLPFPQMRMIALLCNIVVVTAGTIIFFKKGLLDLRKIAPLVACSIPMAFVGALLPISQEVFFVVLGISLLVASLLLFVNREERAGPESQKSNKNFLTKKCLLGGGIGLLSGMVGIGGGIFLSPLLNLMNWDTPKKIAATASLFILVNSLSGMAGLISHLPSEINWRQVLTLVTAVFAGGQIGSRLNAFKLDQNCVRRLTAIVIFIAGIEVLHKHIPWFNLTT